MAFTDYSEHRLVWQYALPAKKDRTLLYKLLQVYFIVLSVIAGTCFLIGIISIMETSYVSWTELLKGFLIIGGFITVVMIVCYPLTILLLRLVVLYLKLLSRIGNGGKKQESNKGTDKKKNTALHILYRFAAEEDKLHSWAAVETKGGKHIRYRSIRKLTRCKESHWIEIYTLLDRTTIYAEEEDFETVWKFISARCPSARIIEENA